MTDIYYLPNVTESKKQILTKNHVSRSNLLKLDKYSCIQNK